MDELGPKLRAKRKSFDLSLKQLSNITGFPASYLSMVENGKVDPSLSRLKKIAKGLETTIVGLFQELSSPDVIVRSKDRRCAEFSNSKTRIEILVPPLPEKQMDARLAIVYPGGSSGGFYCHPGEEFGFLLKGRLQLTVSGNTYDLLEGDSFYFLSTENHSFKNAAKEEAVVLWVNHPPSW